MLNFYREDILFNEIAKKSQNTYKNNEWELRLVESSLNLRVKQGYSHRDYHLGGNVARAQLQFSPDVIANVEDMECDSLEYDTVLQRSYQKINATDDRQHRGISCWVKKEYGYEKVYAMTDPHFLHVRIHNDNKYINMMIIRILIYDSGEDDFKDRRIQWERVLNYIDKLEDRCNLILTGDFNHGVIAESYVNRPRAFYNYQQIASELKERGIPIIPIDGFSYQGYMKIDHLAASRTIDVCDAMYKDVFHGSHKIGIPDHSFIVSDLRLFE